MAVDERCFVNSTVAAFPEEIIGGEGVGGGEEFRKEEVSDFEIREGGDCSLMFSSWIAKSNCRFSIARHVTHGGGGDSEREESKEIEKCELIGNGRGCGE